MTPEWIQFLPEAARAQALAHLAMLESENRCLREILRLRRLERYGRGSESLTDNQLWLLAQETSLSAQELHQEAQQAEKDKKAAAAPPRPKKEHPGREALPAHLPRVEVIIPCPPEQQSCEQCHEPNPVIGYESSEELCVKPAEYFVKVTKREKRACAKHPEAGVATAPVPAKLLPKSKLSDEVIIDVLVRKYQWHLPLYRQAQILEREAQVVIDRHTLDDGVLWAGELLMNLQEPMRRELLAGHYLQADETPVEVLLRLLKGRTHRAYFWQYSVPGGGAVFDFRMGRGREGPQAFLSDFWGTLQTDGFSAYDHLEPPNLVGPPRLRHAGCMAHCRRYFVKAHEAAPKETQALGVVKQIAALYEVERQAKEQGRDAAGRLALRQEKSVGLMAELKSTIEQLKGQALPKSALGRACTYALNQWERLIVFLRDGSIEIDNNGCEQSMRGHALGRRNWMHLGSESAGPKVAAILSVIETCRRLKIDVRAYLKEVLPRLAQYPLPHLAELTPLAWQRRQPEKTA